MLCITHSLSEMHFNSFIPSINHMAKTNHCFCSHIACIILVCRLILNVCACFVCLLFNVFHCTFPFPILACFCLFVWCFLMDHCAKSSCSAGLFCLWFFVLMTVFLLISLISSTLQLLIRMSGCLSFCLVAMFDCMMVWLVFCSHSCTAHRVRQKI